MLKEILDSISPIAIAVERGVVRLYESNARRSRYAVAPKRHHTTIFDEFTLPKVHIRKKRRDLSVWIVRWRSLCDDAESLRRLETVSQMQSRVRPLRDKDTIPFRRHQTFRVMRIASIFIRNPAPIRGFASQRRFVRPRCVRPQNFLRLHRRSCSQIRIQRPDEHRRRGNDRQTHQTTHDGWFPRFHPEQIERTDKVAHHFRIMRQHSAQLFSPSIRDLPVTALDVGLHARRRRHD